MHPNQHGRSVARYSSFVFLAFSVGSEWSIHTVAFRSSFNKSAELEWVRLRMQICLRNACCVCEKRCRPLENNAEQQGALCVKALGHTEKITHPRWRSFRSLAAVCVTGNMALKVVVVCKEIIKCMTSLKSDAQVWSEVTEVTVPVMLILPGPNYFISTS